MFSHRIVHWVYNYMFRPCILDIVRLYYILKQLYSLQYNLTIANIQGRNMWLYVFIIIIIIIIIMFRKD